MKFGREFMINMLYGDNPHTEKIRDEIVDHSRWSIHHEVIFKFTKSDVYYSAYYSEGATEMQDERPWEYQKHIEVIKVHPVEKTVIVYEPVPVNICKCGAEGEEAICPFDEDVHNKKTICYCCEYCRMACAREI